MMSDENRCMSAMDRCWASEDLRVKPKSRQQPALLASLLLLLLATSTLAAALHGASGHPHVPALGQSQHHGPTTAGAPTVDTPDGARERQLPANDNPSATGPSARSFLTGTTTEPSAPMKTRCSIKLLPESFDRERSESLNPLRFYVVPQGEAVLWGSNGPTNSDPKVPDARFGLVWGSNGPPNSDPKAPDARFGLVWGSNGPPNSDPKAPDARFGLSLPPGCDYMERQTKNKVICTGSNITQIPDFSMVMRNLESLHFTSTGIQRVTIVDKFPRSVSSLCFSSGSLSMFDGRRLYEIMYLETLSLGFNTMSTWSFATTFNTTDAPGEITLTTLNLQNNLITYPPDPVGEEQTVLPYLETLVMNNNPLCNLPGKLFQPLRESPLTNLFLRNCSLGQFYGSPLEYVKGLEVLDLSINMGLTPDELEVLLEPLRGGRLRELYLSNNNYGFVPTSALALVNSSLEILDLHGSSFQCLDNSSFPAMPRLTKLNLMYCRINTVRPHTFQSFPVLQELNLDGNGLVTVPPDILLPTLQVLTLSENPRTTGTGGPSDFSMEAVTFKHMEKLRSITFSGVPLGQVSASYFNDLHGLHFLYLSSCKISDIERFSFRNLSLLERLNLNGNNIQVLENDTFFGLTSLTHLNLSDNSIVFLPSIDLTLKNLGAPEGSSFLPLQVLYDVSGSIARWAEGKQESQKESRELQGRSQTLRLTEAPDRSSHPKALLPFEGLRALQFLDLSENDIRSIYPELWEDLESLTYLSLGSNNLRQWTTPNFANSTPNLATLLLMRNSLALLTEAMVLDFSRETLAAVDLRMNMFVCGCSIVSFNDSLNTTHFVDWATYQCNEDGELLSFSEYMANATCEERDSRQPQETQPSSFGIKTIIIVVSVSLSLVMTSVTIYKKRWYVRYVMYTVKMRATAQKEDADNYLYDTFVCYSQTNRQWVFEHLVAKLEDGGRYRVCVHERDFTVGQEITENIINSVERSRKVVVVLSPSFVESSWCMFELQMASNKILDERKNKLILLVLEPIPEEQQPKKLRLLLKTRTYIAWVPEAGGEEQKLFWARLLRAIAKPPAPSIDSMDATTHL